MPPRQASGQPLHPIYALDVFDDALLIWVAHVHQRAVDWDRIVGVSR